MADGVEMRDNAADARAFAVVRILCRRSAKDFYYSSVFLPRFKRDAACAVYAFVRLINEALRQPEGEDNASTCCSASPLDQRLEVMRALIRDIDADRMELPLPEFRSQGQHVLHAVAQTIRRYEIPPEYFLAIAEGCRTDLTTRRYATWKSLEAHCDHTAGVAARIIGCVFGLRHSDAGQQLVQLGNAMRLTSILRDVQTDFRQARIYLPLEDMVRFGYSERDLARSVVNENFRELMRFQIARARQLYREGSAGLCWLADDGSRLTAATIAVIHSGILRSIERQNHDVLTRRIVHLVPDKLRRLPNAWKLARRTAVDPIPSVF
jgi:phytoene synthase